MVPTIDPLPALETAVPLFRATMERLTWTVEARKATPRPEAWVPETVTSLPRSEDLITVMVSAHAPPPFTVPCALGPPSAEVAFPVIFDPEMVTAAPTELIGGSAWAALLVFD